MKKKKKHEILISTLRNIVTEKLLKITNGNKIMLMRRGVLFYVNTAHYINSKFHVFVAEKFFTFSLQLLRNTR